MKTYPSSKQKFDNFRPGFGIAAGIRSGSTYNKSGNTDSILYSI
jgi:hypothetical protein